MKVLTDWRNPAKWDFSDLARTADLCSVSYHWTDKPIANVRTLPYWQPGVLMNDGGLAGPYNSGLAVAAGSAVLDDREIWASGTTSLKMIDLTARDVVGKVADFLLERHAWADGIHLDYWTELSWLFPDMTLAYSQRWNAALASLATALRKARPDWLLIGQQYHLVPETMANLSGLWLENYPTAFQTPLVEHTADLKRFAEVVLRLDPKREILWVAELREPEKFTASYKQAVKAWAEGDGFALSVGRDATAGGVL